MSERNLHREFAQAYMWAVRDYDRAAARGDQEKIDSALARKQELERGVSITVHNPAVLA
ncbi:MAG: hypothetical protein ISS15_05435 [Alphaproteobacteria bacterium]|nr:hypothetical protein [Alphaproteobacteria bacterium]MBL6939437.1 hypothetical protein [Alphaproteobacteria bacterium]MBL7097082.1 hypothetical protein [Alphaproteobacteria bacterium]